MQRWRKRVKDHVIVCGYGTKGRAAVSALLENGLDKSQIVVVEPSAGRGAAGAGRRAGRRRGLRDPVDGAQGGATSSTPRRSSSRPTATTPSVLVTLTVRQLTAGQVPIIAAAREAENAPLLKQSGAHHVIVSSATAGRLLGLSTTAPPLIEVVEDLLTPGQGMALAMRSAAPRRGRLGAAGADELVIALFRRGKVLSLADRAAPRSRPATCSSTSATTARRPPRRCREPLMRRFVQRFVWFVMVAAALLAALSLASPAAAHGGASVTIHSDGRGSVWITAQWQDGHPINEPTLVTLTATPATPATPATGGSAAPGGSAAIAGRSFTQTGDERGTQTWSGVLPPGSWRVAIDLGAPVEGHCQALVPALAAAGTGTPQPVEVACLIPATAATAPAGGEPTSSWSAGSLAPLWVTLGVLLIAGLVVAEAIRRRKQRQT